MTHPNGYDEDFNNTVGMLDFVLSKLMLARDALNRGELSEANIQTLKHHAEDMIGAGNSMLAAVERNKLAKDLTEELVNYQNAPATRAILEEAERWLDATAKAEPTSEEAADQWDEGLENSDAVEAAKEVD